MNASALSGDALEALSPAEDSTATLVVSGIVTGLGIICVALRFLVRIRMKVHLGWDDWWCLISMLATLLSGALLIAGRGFGLYFVSSQLNALRQWNRSRRCSLLHRGGE